MINMLKAPMSRGFVDDMAFTLYAMDIEESRDRMEKALGHLIQDPEVIDELQYLYNLDDEELEWVLAQR